MSRIRNINNMYDLNKIKRKNICIIGLMGSGKSIIGKDLSKYLNFKFYDTDKEIELSTKKVLMKFLKNMENCILENWKKKFVLNY